MGKLAIADLQEFYLKGMRNGWTSEGVEQPLDKMPGFTGVPYRHGDLYMLDNWCVGVYGDKSCGSTIIWQNDQPVWVMNYGGSYNATAIPFLKRALQANYVRNVFIGGRGPLAYREEGQTLIYINSPHEGSSFKMFRGREIIVDEAKQEWMGWHDYWGLCLL